MKYKDIYMKQVSSKISLNAPYPRIHYIHRNYSKSLHGIVTTGFLFSPYIPCPRSSTNKCRPGFLLIIQVHGPPTCIHTTISSHRQLPTKTPKAWLPSVRDSVNHRNRRYLDNWPRKTPKGWLRLVRDLSCTTETGTLSSADEKTALSLAVEMTAIFRTPEITNYNLLHYQI